MKKTITLLVLICLSVGVFAQRANYQSAPAQKAPLGENGSRDISNVFMVPLSWVPTSSGGLGCNLFIYTFSDNTYVMGNNSFGDLEKAQGYNTDLYWEGALTEDPKVDSVFVDFALKSVGSPGDEVVINIYDGNDQDGPQTLLGTTEAVTLEN